MSDVNSLIAAMKLIPGYQKVVKGTTRLPDMVTYAVVQGGNILTIGSGESKRLKTLMGNSGTHNKAPIIGLCYRLYKEPIDFYICRYTPSETKNSLEERQLQAVFGETNIDSKKSYREAMGYLREKLNIQESSVESILLDLMGTHGDILSHALRTESTAQTVEALFNAYWKKSRKLENAA